MLFSSTIFIFLFLPSVLFVYYVILKNKRKMQNLFLLFTSLIFYAWGEPWFVFVMIASIIFNWFFGLLVEKYNDDKVKVRIIITVTLVLNLGIIFIFKYLMFSIDNMNRILKLSITVPKILLPIGISFFTFQAISYVIDIYRGNGEAQKNPLNVGLYISFFPQLIAGPIVRYETVAEQIMNRNESFEDFSKGMCRFIIGLAKKVLLANTLAVVADKAFSLNDTELSLSFAWLGAIAYSFQIYYDFSGYSDMAIGLGKMFGFHFLENFNYPYISKSVSEFWRRWHMSLGSWFRDYLYFPLGGSKVKSRSRLILNLFVVWFLTGIWHGANWTFILWGLYYFVLITLEKLTDFEQKLKNKPKLGFYRSIYVILVFIFGWVLFRANNLNEAFNYIRTMMGFGSKVILDNLTLFYLYENIYFFALAFVFSIPIAKKMEEKFINSVLIGIIYPLTLLLLFFISVTYMVKGAYNPFIYFNF